MPTVKILTFFDGEVTIEGVTYNFGEDNIGYKRHYAAKTAGEAVSKVIHIPYTRDIRMNSLAVIGEESYIIDLVQPKRDSVPPATFLTLIDYGVSSNDRR